MASPATPVDARDAHREPRCPVPFCLRAKPRRRPPGCAPRRQRRARPILALGVRAAVEHKP